MNRRRLFIAFFDESAHLKFWEQIFFDQNIAESAKPSARSALRNASQNRPTYSVTFC